jgi:DNA-binding NtrC family response regulator
MPAAIELLSRVEWPSSNVHQLQSEIERAVVLARDDDVLTPEHLSSELQNVRHYSPINQRATHEVRVALAEHGPPVAIAPVQPVLCSLREAHEVFELQKKLNHYGLR